MLLKLLVTILVPLVPTGKLPILSFLCHSQFVLTTILCCCHCFTTVACACAGVGSGATVV